MGSRRLALTLAGLVAVFGIAMGLVSLLPRLQQASPLATIGGPFSLVDQNNHPVTEATYRGAPMLVFFGYTHCPDVCPTTLADMSRMLAALGTDKTVHALFITVDPEQDTPAILKDYVASFDPRIVGLTGSPEAIAQAEKAYRVYAKKVPLKDGGYSMDHTAVVYLMDKAGRFVNAMNLEQAPDKAAADLAAYL